MEKVMQMPDGSTFAVTKPIADRERDPIEIEMSFARESYAPPPHVHPFQREEYEVLEGEMELRIGDERRRLGPGATASVPAGTVHTFQIGPNGVRVRNVHAPALEFEEMVETLYRLGQAGILTSGKSVKTLIYIAMAYERYRRTIVVAGPFRPAVWLLARLGRLLRWRLDVSPGEVSGVPA